MRTRVSGLKQGLQSKAGRGLRLSEQDRRLVKQRPGSGRPPRVQEQWEARTGFGTREWRGQIYFWRGPLRPPLAAWTVPGPPRPRRPAP